MIISFNKYHGTGNDFILIDNRNNTFELDTASVKHLCDRRFGIGGDGLMLLQSKANYDFEMIYYNSDGNIGSMCGNGGRCIVAFAKHLGLIRNKTVFLASDGEHLAEILDNTDILKNNSLNEKVELVKLKMNDVNKIDLINDNYFINTGSPHYIKFVKYLENIDVYNEGKKIRYSEPFKPGGTNVNFVELNQDYIFVRTYERGVEDETYSCGTGATASTIATALKTNNVQSSLNIKTKGGNLRVYLKKNDSGFSDIWLEGPATFVYSGVLEI